MGDRRIAGLDGIRAACVVLVFVEHFVLWGRGLGGVGVKVFFTLSGFLIIGILHQQRIKMESGRGTFKSEMIKFWKSRALRIFPPYYLALALTTAYLLVKGLPNQGIGYYWVFLGNYYIQHISHNWGLFTHLWSISVEQHFYMLASPVLLLIPAGMHLRAIVALFAFSGAASALDFANWESVPKPYLAAVPNFAFMAAGGILALANASARERLSSFAAPLFVVGVSLYAFVSFRGQSVPDTGAVRAIISLAAMGICIGSIWFTSSRQNSWVVSILELKPIRYMGTISYGFYIYHCFMPNLAQYSARIGGFPFSSSILVLIQFMLTVALAALSWRHFERPLLELKKRGQSAAAFDGGLSGANGGAQPQR